MCSVSRLNNFATYLVINIDSHSAYVFYLVVMNSFMAAFIGFVIFSNSLEIVNSIKVSIYYEALCGDSVRFIAKQLNPHFRELTDYIELDMVPYGKAMHAKKPDGTYEFLCQHGPLECLGNKLQSCVLAHNNDQTKNVQFVNCIMRRRNSTQLTTAEACANRYQLDVSTLKECSEGTEGNKLLAANGDKTWRLEPSISFVPTIIFDDKYDDDVQNQSLIDFVAIVCSKIVGTKPTICKNRRLPIVTVSWY